MKLALAVAAHVPVMGTSSSSVPIQGTVVGGSAVQMMAVPP